MLHNEELFDCLFLLPLVDLLANLIFFNLPNIAIDLIKIDLRDLSVQCVLLFQLVHTEVLPDLHLEQCLRFVLLHENVEVSLCGAVNTLDATARQILQLVVYRVLFVSDWIDYDAQVALDVGEVWPSEGLQPTAVGALEVNLATGSVHDLPG